MAISSDDLDRMVATDFASNYAEIVKIKRKSDGVQIPMVLNQAQMFLEALAEEQIAGMGMVGLMVLKGGQVGCTQWVAARYFRKVSLSRGRRVYVLAHGRRHSASAGASSTTGSPSTAPLTPFRGQHQNPGAEAIRRGRQKNAGGQIEAR